MVHDVVEKKHRASLSFSIAHRCMQRDRKCSQECFSPCRAEGVLWSYVDECDQKIQRR